MTSLHLALLNLSRRWVPTLIAVVSIALSVACSGILLRLYLVSENRFSTLGAGGDAVVGAKAGGIDIILNALNGEGNYPGYLPYRLFQSLEAEQTVQFEDGVQAKPTFIRSIIPFVYFAKYEEFRLVGTSKRFLERPREEDSLHLKDGVWSENSNEVVLGSEVAESLAEREHLKLGGVIEVRPWAGDSVTQPSMPVTMKIVGTLQSTGSAWDREIFSNIPTAQQTLASMDLSRVSIWGPQVLNYFLIYLEPRGFAPLEALVNRRTVGQVVLVDEQKARLAELTGTGKKLGLFVMILTLVLGALAVSSMLITRFEAMLLQLAVLRALGYRKKQIGQWLLWEGFLLGLFSCLIGICLDMAFFPLMRGWLGSALPGPDLVRSSILESSPIWITALLATTASVFVPLYRVYHQDVHRSLRD